MVILSDASKINFVQNHVMHLDGMYSLLARAFEPAS